MENFFTEEEAFQRITECRNGELLDIMLHRLDLEYKRALNSTSTIERKAEAMIKYVLTGLCASVIFGFFTKTYLESEMELTFLGVLVGLCLWSIIFAIKAFSVKKYAGVSSDVILNKNCINYYNQYPKEIDTDNENDARYYNAYQDAESTRNDRGDFITYKRLLARNMWQCWDSRNSHNEKKAADLETVRVLFMVFIFVFTIGHMILIAGAC